MNNQYSGKDEHPTPMSSDEEAGSTIYALIFIILLIILYSIIANFSDYLLIHFLSTP